MGNLPPHMLRNFYVIEPTRDCLINKDSRKPSKSRRMKCTACLWITFVHAQVSQLSFPQEGFLPLVGQHLQFLWEDFLWWLDASSVSLHPPVSSSCFPCDQLHCRSCRSVSLDLRNNDHNTACWDTSRFFRRTKDFFLRWSSFLTQLWLCYSED